MHLPSTIWLEKSNCMIINFHDSHLKVLRDKSLSLNWFYYSRLSHSLFFQLNISSMFRRVSTALESTSICYFLNRHRDEIAWVRRQMDPHCGIRGFHSAKSGAILNYLKDNLNWGTIIIFLCWEKANGGDVPEVFLCSVKGKLFSRIAFCYYRWYVRCSHLL